MVPQLHVWVLGHVVIPTIATLAQVQDALLQQVAAAAAAVVVVVVVVLVVQTRVMLYRQQLSEPLLC